jgi:hypothetical protein
MRSRPLRVVEHPQRTLEKAAVAAWQDVLDRQSDYRGHRCGRNAARLFFSTVRWGRAQIATGAISVADLDVELSDIARLFDVECSDWRRHVMPGVQLPHGGGPDAA